MDKQTTLELFEDIDSMLDENDAVLDEFIIDMKDDTVFDDITINTEDFIIGSETLNIGESDSFADMEIDMNNEIFDTISVEETVDVANGVQVEEKEFNENDFTQTYETAQTIDTEVVNTTINEFLDDKVEDEIVMEIEKEVEVVEQQPTPVVDTIEIEPENVSKRVVETSELDSLLNDFNIINNKEVEEIAIKVEEELQILKEKEEFGQVNIMVMGIGACGCNVINRMYEEKNKDIKLIAVDTSEQSLEQVACDYKLLIGEEQFKGHGSGGDTTKVELAFANDKERIQKLLDGVDMLFLAGGFGKGTGSVGLISVGKMAKELGILTIGFSTLPRRMEANVAVLDEYFPLFSESVDATIIIENERIGRVAKDLKIAEAMKLADSMLVNGIKGIYELITKPGKINLDYADIRTAFANQGSSVMGVGFGKGENPVVKAIEDAFGSDIVDFASVKTAKTMIFNITCARRAITIDEASKGTEMLYSMANTENMKHLLFGYSYDDSLGDTVKVTFIATGTKPMEYDFSKSLTSLGINEAFTRSFNTEKLKSDEAAEEKIEIKIEASERPNFFK